MNVMMMTLAISYLPISKSFKFSKICVIFSNKFELFDMKIINDIIHHPTNGSSLLSVIKIE